MVLDLQRDMFPISQEDSLVHETTISTTSVLDPRMGPTPYLPKKEFSLVHETTIDRVLRYSILERDKFPISKNLVIQEMTIHRLLRTRLREDTKLLTPRRNPSSSRRQLVDYHSTRPMKNQNLLLPRRNYHPQKHRIIDYYSTRTISPFPTKELLVHETTSKSTTTVFEEMIQDSR